MMWREAEEAVSSFVLKKTAPSCLPHSGPECQKAVQWGVRRQRSAYGNAPADTLQRRAGGDETQQTEA